MITIRDVARQAGVSVATVSRVLNNSALVSPDTRDVVMKAVTQLGYRPNANAQALATQVSDTIGVVVMDVSDAFFGALVKAVDTVAQQHQKYVLIGNSYHEAEKERHAIEVLIRQRCSALIVHSNSLVLTGWKRAETSTPRLRTQPALTTTDVAPTAWSIGTVMIWSVVSLW